MTLRKMLTNIVAALLAVTCLNAAAQDAPKPTTPKLAAVVERAYLYGLQQAIYYGQRWTYTQNDVKTNDVYAGLNQFAWVRKQITPDYPVVTPDGKPFSGKDKYTMTFDMNDLPPVTQFWSIPIYDANGYFVANEINRYTVNSFMLAAGDLAAEDSKLVIYVQHEKPSDPVQARNWLPAPADGFRFTARFYGPYAPLTNGSYNMPKVVKVKD